MYKSQIIIKNHNIEWENNVHFFTKPHHQIWLRMLDIMIRQLPIFLIITMTYVIIIFSKSNTKIS